MAQYFANNCVSQLNQWLKRWGHKCELENKGFWRKIDKSIISSKHIESKRMRDFFSSFFPSAQTSIEHKFCVSCPCIPDQTKHDGKVCEVNERDWSSFLVQSPSRNGRAVVRQRASAILGRRGQKLQLDTCEVHSTSSSNAWGSTTLFVNITLIIMINIP